MTALSATEQATLDRIEAAPAAEESLRERVARAIWEDDNAQEFDWEDYESEHEQYRVMASAAIAVMRGER